MLIANSEKTIICSFAGVMFSDYWSGHHLPTLAVPVHGKTTRKELLESLNSELTQGMIDYELDEEGITFEDVKKAVKQCLYYCDACRDSDKPFSELVEPSDESCEWPNAYFVIEQIEFD